MPKLKENQNLEMFYNLVHLPTMYSVNLFKAMKQVKKMKIHLKQNYNKELS